MLGVIEDSRNEFKIKLPDDLVWLSLTIWMLVFFVISLISIQS